MFWFTKLFQQREIPAPQNAITHEVFDVFVQTHRFAVIHFWASWNGIDQLMTELLETEIPAELRQQLAVASFDIDPEAHHERCRQHDVKQVPFLAFYRDGSLVRTVSGMRKPEVIADYLKDLVGEST